MILLVSNERIVFCIKLWLKEANGQKTPITRQQSIMRAYIEQEFLTGEYCSNEEFEQSRL